MQTARYCFPILTKSLFYLHTFINVKFHENRCSRSRQHTSVRKEGRTDGLTPWQHFTRRESFYGGLMSLVTTKCRLFISSCKLPYIFVRFWPKMDFLDRFSQNHPQDQISRKSVLQQPGWYIWAKRRKDVTKLIGPFREYAKAHKTLIFKGHNVFVTLSYCIR
jgi:hypothetical protein